VNLQECILPEHVAADEGCDDACDDRETQHSLEFDTRVETDLLLQ